MYVGKAQVLLRTLFPAAGVGDGDGLGDGEGLGDGDGLGDGLGDGEGLGDGFGDGFVAYQTPTAAIRITTTMITACIWVIALFFRISGRIFKSFTKSSIR